MPSAGQGSAGLSAVSLRALANYQDSAENPQRMPLLYLAQILLQRRNFHQIENFAKPQLYYTFTLPKKQQNKHERFT